MMQYANSSSWKWKMLITLISNEAGGLPSYACANRTACVPS